MVKHALAYAACKSQLDGAVVASFHREFWSKDGTSISDSTLLLTEEV